MGCVNAVKQMCGGGGWMVMVIDWCDGGAHCGWYCVKRRCGIENKNPQIDGDIHVNHSVVDTVMETSCGSGSGCGCGCGYVRSGD